MKSLQKYFKSLQKSFVLKNKKKSQNVVKTVLKPKLNVEKNLVRIFIDFPCQFSLVCRLKYAKSTEVDQQQQKAAIMTIDSSPLLVFFC